MTATKSFDDTFDELEFGRGPDEEDWSYFSEEGHASEPTSLSPSRDVVLMRYIRQHLSPLRSLFIFYGIHERTESTIDLLPSLHSGLTSESTEESGHSLLVWLTSLLEEVYRDLDYRKPGDLSPDPQPVPDWWFDQLAQFGAREDPDFESPWG